MVFYLIDLLHESNAAIVKAADQALDIVNDLDEEWATKLRALKFEAHNEAWLEACANGSTTQQQVRQAQLVHALFQLEALSMQSSVVLTYPQ